MIASPETAARMGVLIEIWGSPFGAANAKRLQKSFALAGVPPRELRPCRTPFRSMAPRSQERWIGHNSGCDSVTFETDLMQHAGDRAASAMRLCDPLAAICLAEQLAHESLGLPAGTGEQRL